MSKSDADSENELPRSVPLKNGKSTLRQPVESELLEARDTLELKTRELAASLAAQAAIAQENARLLEAAKLAAEEREKLLAGERMALAEAERMLEMKDEFLATLSHELRTPLNAILGWSQMLRRGVRTEADMHKGLDTIERNARAQAQLIEDLLDMSRINSGKLRLDIQPLEPGVVIQAAAETVRPAAEAKGIRLEIRVDPDTGWISGDSARLQQVVWNLMSNAIKFTPKGGTVQVLVERVSSHIEISVGDSGVGIDKEFLSHVFERFRQADGSITRRYGGLGLGLSIVRSLVELHGGTVHVTSPGVGFGSTFMVMLPLVAAQSQALHELRPVARALARTPVSFLGTDLSGISVLVVDDETDTREMIRQVLADCNAEVFMASSAEEALVLLQEKRPLLLVSDIGMPDVDGYELLRRVRELGPKLGGAIPAIALTAFARPEDRGRALEAGFQAHIAKPMDLTDFVTNIARIVGTRRGN
jgi:signal transduction histidine kinase/CheY-like chemotaxis protein